MGMVSMTGDGNMVDGIASYPINTSPPLIDWAAREHLRDKAHEDALDLIHTIRAEIQGGDHSGWFVTYRLSR